MSQFSLNVYTYIHGLKQVKAMEENKYVAWDDATKHFLFHKATILTNLLGSFKHQNVKYEIK